MTITRITTCNIILWTKSDLNIWFLCEELSRWCNFILQIQILEDNIEDIFAIQACYTIGLVYMECSFVFVVEAVT